MQSTKTSKGILLALLLVFVVGLTSVNIYQDRVIQKQRFELQWLVTHATIRPETIVADLAKEGKLPKKSGAVQAPAANVVPAASPAPPAAQVAPAVKP
ncbi:MAG TPA: hypothetical protein VJX29_06665 [Candidatus Acidoferrales bacterium]|nr:hypothetical protein [Candidatus Acidoferrales bacterium]